MGSGLFGMLDISASGMSAERFRMEVVANNIANAQTTRDVDGQPYRRKQVVFEAQLQDALSLNGGLLSDPQMGGVRVAGVAPDMSDFHEILQSGSIFTRSCEKGTQQNQEPHHQTPSNQIYHSLLRMTGG